MLNLNQKPILKALALKNGLGIRPSTNNGRGDPRQKS